MNTRIVTAACALLAALLIAHAQTPVAGSTATIIDRGQNYRVWTATVNTTNLATGMVVQGTQQWTELGNFLCYWDNGWKDSQDLLEQVGGTAVARHSSMKVIFSKSANSPVVIDLATDSGTRLQSKVTGIQYFDTQSGTLVPIASIKDSAAVLYPPNQLVYPDCFDAIHADLRYTYNVGAFEQDLVLLESLPDPAAPPFNLNPSTTLVQLYTAFPNAPAPQIRERAVGTTTDQRPPIIDHLLDFGDLVMPTGAAFWWDSGNPANSTSAAQVRIPDLTDTSLVPIGKQWINVKGTSVLVESVRYSDLAPKLAALGKTGFLKLPKTRDSVTRLQVVEDSRQSEITVSSVPYKVRGLVWDYLLSGSQSSFTFTSGTTYTIANSFTVGSSGGTATFQNNTVIKYSPNTYLLVYGRVSFPGNGTGPFAVFTSIDDNTFGGTTGSGSPAYNAAQALWLYYDTYTMAVSNARFRWAKRAVQYDQNPGVAPGASLGNCSFENSQTGIYLNCQQDTMSLSGVLTANVQTPVSVASGYYTGSVGTVTNVSRAIHSQGEPTIAINPKNANNYVVVFMNYDGSLVCNWTLNGNSGTWTFGGASYADPCAAFDSYGNCFLSCTGGSIPVTVFMSSNGGQTWNPVGSFAVGHGGDKPWLAVGPDADQVHQCVWVTWRDMAAVNSWPIGVVGGRITAPGTTPTWGSTFTLSGSINYTYPSVSVGPSGQVLVSAQKPYPYSNETWLNTTGSSSPSWSSASRVAVLTGMGTISGSYVAPAPHRPVYSAGYLAYSSNGPNHKRVYMAYADYPDRGNTPSIFIIYSDDDGVSWSSRLQISDGPIAGYYFYPAIAVDQVSGKVGVCWYDTRNDTAGYTTQCFGTTTDGASFLPNFLLGPGPSNAHDPLTDEGQYWNVADYLDYCGLAYRNGVLRIVWMDNSNCDNNNFYTSSPRSMDVYMCTSNH